MMRPVLALAIASVGLASCGRPDASGIYVAASPNQVTLVQLVETKEGNVTGRLEQVSADANGVVSDQTAAIDGAASQNELMFKPTSVWLEGLAASGTFSGDQLTLAGRGFTINAQRSTLSDYQKSVADLQSVAAIQRQRFADARAAQAARDAQQRAARAAFAAQQQAEREFAANSAGIAAGTAQLRNDTARLSAGIANCPNFGGRSAANTARIANMLQAAPALSGYDRGRLTVAATQVEIGTNQIENARSQYAIELNQIVQDAAPVAERIANFCASPQGAQFSQQCADAKAATDDLKAAVLHGRDAFIGYKQAVRAELDRQQAMIQRIGG